MNQTTLEQIIACPVTSGDPQQFIATRYPFTYAYDYLRSHPQKFGIDPAIDCRADIARWCHENFPRDERLVMISRLADAYILENNVVKG